MNVNEALNLLSFTTRERQWGDKLIKYDWSVGAKEKGSPPIFNVKIHLHEFGRLQSVFYTEIDADPLQGQLIESVVEELEKAAIAHVLEVCKDMNKGVVRQIKENNERINTA